MNYLRNVLEPWLPMTCLVDPWKPPNNCKLFESQRDDDLIPLAKIANQAAAVMSKT